MGCNNCDDAHIPNNRSNVHDDMCECEECVDKCPVGKECECPIRLQDVCVCYSGCDLFFTKIRRGDNMEDVIAKIDAVIKSLDGKVRRYRDEIEDLKSEMTKINEKIRDLK